MSYTVEYDEGPNNDSTEFPWALVLDGGVCDRFETQDEARQVADEFNRGSL